MIAQPASTPTTPIITVGPIAPQERIQVVDILRGFALLGILLVNMAIFRAGWAATQPVTPATTGMLDRLAAHAIDLFAEGKFFTLFSFLFGFGFAIQMIRAQERGVAFVPRFMRRLLVLFVIGLAHAFLLWCGDILVSYALLGFVLLLFRNRSPRALLIWATILLLGMALLLGAVLGLIEYGRTVPDGAEQIVLAEQGMRASFAQQADEELRVYSSGSYSEIVAYRARSMPSVYATVLFQAPPILAMFLLGLYAGKRGIFHDPAAHTTLLRRVRFWGVIVGLLLSLLVVLVETQRGILSAALAPLLNMSLAGPILSMGYAATITLLAQHERWRARLAPLGAAGRMALTNYLLQTLICTTIFYGYGLSLFGQVGAAAGVGLTIAIYALQISFSVWWLQRFRFGPMEWLWRSLTYGHVQPLRQHAVPGR